jgi:hypothetical protein
MNFGINWQNLLQGDEGRVAAHEEERIRKGHPHVLAQRDLWTVWTGKLRVRRRFGTLFQCLIINP